MHYDYIFLGSKQFGFEVFRAAFESAPEKKWLVVSPADSSDGRSVVGEFQKFCSQRNIDFQSVSNRTQSEELLKNNPAKAALVCGWYWLIPRTVLDLFPFGVWGIHNSLLPKYRGGSPLVWSLINGEKIVGSSLFEITDGMDSGDLLGQVKEKVSETDDISTLTNRLQIRMTQLVADKWKSIDLKHLKRKKQKERHATFCGQRIPEDGGIHWNLPAEVIRNFIRAQTIPYPGAFSFHKASKVTIYKCSVLPLRYSGTPGQVLLSTPHDITISCGGETAVLVQRKDLAYENPDSPELSFHSRLTPYAVL